MYIYAPKNILSGKIRFVNHDEWESRNGGAKEVLLAWKLTNCSVPSQVPNLRLHIFTTSPSSSSRSVSFIARPCDHPITKPQKLIGGQVERTTRGSRLKTIEGRTRTHYR